MSSVDLFHSAYYQNTSDLRVAILEGDFTAFLDFCDTFPIQFYRDAFENTALHFACEAMSPHIVKYLCENTPLVGNEVNSKGETPLSIAARGGNTSVIRQLLKKGARVDHRVNGVSIPFRLVSNCHYLALQVIVEEFPPVEYVKSGFADAFNYAIMHHQEAFIHYMLNQKKITMGLSCAVLNPSLEEKYQGTPLCVAIRSGNFAVVGQLAQKGVNLDTSDDSLVEEFSRQVAEAREKGQDDKVTIYRKFQRSFNRRNKMKVFFLHRLSKGTVLKFGLLKRLLYDFIE